MLLRSQIVGRRNNQNLQFFAFHKYKKTNKLPEAMELRRDSCYLNVCFGSELLPRYSSFCAKRQNLVSWDDGGSWVDLSKASSLN